jgi:hypothetical protein
VAVKQGREGGREVQLQKTRSRVLRRMMTILRRVRRVRRVRMVRERQGQGCAHTLAQMYGRGSKEDLGG